MPAIKNFWQRYALRTRYSAGYIWQFRTYIRFSQWKLENCKITWNCFYTKLLQQRQNDTLVFGNTVKEGEIEYTDTLRNAYQWLYLPTGNLLAVSASELIQCLSYPELEMEITFTLTVAAGWYAVAREYLPAANSAIEKIYYCKKEPTVSHFHNIS